MPILLAHEKANRFDIWLYGSPLVSLAIYKLSGDRHLIFQFAIEEPEELPFSSATVSFH